MAPTAQEVSTDLNLAEQGRANHGIVPVDVLIELSPTALANTCASQLGQVEKADAELGQVEKADLPALMESTPLSKSAVRLLGRNGAAQTEDPGHLDKTGKVLDEIGTSNVDPSVLFGLERTLLSGYNVALFVVMTGVGLHTIAPYSEETNQGTALVVGGMLFIISNFMMHMYRCRMMQTKRSVSVRNSACQMGFLSMLLLVALALELYNAQTHPYLGRSTPVTVEDKPPHSA